MVSCADIWWACTSGLHPLSPDMPWDSMSHRWQDSLPPSALKTCMTRSHLEAGWRSFRPWCEGQTAAMAARSMHGWPDPLSEDQCLFFYIAILWEDLQNKAKQNGQKQDLLILIVSNWTGGHKVSCPCFVYQEKGQLGPLSCCYPIFHQHLLKLSFIQCILLIHLCENRLGWNFFCAHVNIFFSSSLRSLCY